MTQANPTNNSGFTSTEFKIVKSTQQQEETQEKEKTLTDDFWNQEEDFGDTDTDSAFIDALGKGANKQNQELYAEIAGNLEHFLMNSGIAGIEAPFDPSVGFMSVSEFLNKERPEPKPLLNGMMNEASHMAIYAPSGAGKTHMVITLAMLAAINEAVDIGLFHNFEGGHQVLLVDGENNPNNAIKRFKSIAEAYEVPLSAIESTLTYHNVVEQGSQFHLREDAHQKVILDLIKRKKIKIAIIDNVRTLYGGEENKAETLDGFNSFLKKIASLGCSAIVVHHTNKGKDPQGWPVYPGSTNFETPYATMMKLRVKKGAEYSKDVGKLTLEFKFQKDRDGITGFRTDSNGDGDVGVISMSASEGINTSRTGASEPAQFSEEEALVIKRLQTWLPSILQEGYEIPDTANKNAIWTDACGPYHNKKGYRDQASKVLPKLVKKLQAKHREIENCSPAFQRV